MKIAISGATSFIGRRFSTYVAEQGNEVVVIIRQGNNDRELPSSANVVNCSMEDYRHLGELVGYCDCFVSLSWNGTRGNSRMDKELQQKNIDYSLDGIHSMLDKGCKKIITAGSQAEYGPCADMITEKTQCRPNTEYGRAKLEVYEKAKNLCEQFAADFKEPRFFSLYGPNDHENTLIISTLSNMLDNRPCQFTQGIQMWDYLFIDDAIKALYLLCTMPCQNGAYNLGSGDVRRLRDYIQEMADITDTKSELRFGAIPYPQTGVVSLWPDISKIKTAFNWKAQTPFSVGLEIIMKAMNRNLLNSK